MDTEDIAVATVSAGAAGGVRPAADAEFQIKNMLMRRLSTVAAPSAAVMQWRTLPVAPAASRSGCIAVPRYCWSSAEQLGLRRSE